ncbi:MAG: prolipoprotein diacylglyceryl transferase [Acidobacteria bacterium]|nr:prolipoprotein diacylglyceryl transferase [Acidobacteriota bacterium]
MKQPLAKLGYAVLFVVLLPALLYGWARQTESLVPLPLPAWPALPFAAAGAILLCGGMWQLWRDGGGLPMNAFPPPRLVTTGLFRLLPHPIYTGFTLLCIAASLQLRSASGLYLVTPVVALGAAALALGYERPDLIARFGPAARRPIALLRPLAPLWPPLRNAAQRIANSWREWRIGPVRVINHGFYAGLGTLLGLCLITAATPPALAWPVFFTVLAGIAGAGLWAQLVEGSPRLLRPYGFYGGLLGVTLACALFDARFLLWGAHSLAGPVVQACGRLRCLVQGCCHGAPCGAAAGIVYRRPESRVTRIAHLDGVPLHATQLYSILWNAATFFVLASLWRAAAPLQLISALWLILNGIGRFVEEAYRGEPQTKSFAGLHLYQWLAIASVLGGILVSCASRVPAAPPLSLAQVNLPLALAGFLVTSFALGVDFPASNRRFARLTSA